MGDNDSRVSGDIIDSLPVKLRWKLIKGDKSSFSAYERCRGLFRATNLLDLAFFIRGDTQASR